MPYPQVTQFETLHLRSREVVVPAEATRLVARKRAFLRAWRAPRRRRTADCATCA